MGFIKINHGNFNCSFNLNDTDSRISVHFVEKINNTASLASEQVESDKPLEISNRTGNTSDSSLLSLQSSYGKMSILNIDCLI